MTSETIIRLLQERIVDVDPATALFTEEQLMVALSDALRVLQVKSVSGMSDYTVVTDPNDADYGFTPEVTDIHGTMLVLKAAVDILNNEFRGRVRTGELGSSWSSGLEQESSITAAKEYRFAIAELADELTSILLIRDTSGTRIQ